MKKIITLLILTLLFSACAQNHNIDDANTVTEKDTPITAYTAVPDKWRSEVIPLPFEFAPEIKLDGLEEILFMPGMYKPEAEDYFSYAFVWKVTQKNLSGKEIQANLHAYYSGLYKAVAEKQTADVSVKINTIKDDWPMTGTIKWIEPFVSKQKQILLYKAKKVTCSNPDETRWYFIVSPQKSSHPVWNSLQDLPLTVC